MLKRKTPNRIVDIDFYTLALGKSLFYNQLHLFESGTMQCDHDLNFTDVNHFELCHTAAELTYMQSVAP